VEHNRSSLTRRNCGVWRRRLEALVQKSITPLHGSPGSWARWTGAADSVWFRAPSGLQNLEADFDQHAPILDERANLVDCFETGQLSGGMAWGAEGNGKEASLDGSSQRHWDQHRCGRARPRWRDGATYANPPNSTPGETVDAGDGRRVNGKPNPPPVSPRRIPHRRRCLAPRTTPNLGMGSPFGGLADRCEMRLTPSLAARPRFM
jgi:hypothetical protein